ncbi:MAG: ABC transporter permease [Elusimicrobiota bacterium]
MFTKIYEITKFTFIENLKNKNFLILFIYMAIVLGSGILFSMLSPQQEIRVILDLGIAAIEIFAFLSCTFISVKLILQEMEQKTVYLILSRPVNRTQYLLGRFFGILSVMFTYIIIMGISLLIMLFLKGWSWNLYYPVMLTYIFFKIIIVASFSVLLSLVSTSPASSFISIFFLWTLGHFSQELQYINHLLKESGIRITLFLKTLYYIIPNFHRLNYKDFFHVTPISFSDFLTSGGYAVLYGCVIITLSTIVFRYKEL